MQAHAADVANDFALFFIAARGYHLTLLTLTLMPLRDENGQRYLDRHVSLHGFPQ